MGETPIVPRAEASWAGQKKKETKIVKLFWICIIVAGLSVYGVFAVIVVYVFSIQPMSVWVWGSSAGISFLFFFFTMAYAFYLRMHIIYLLSVIG
jgi:hypothetical protein